MSSGPAIAMRRGRAQLVRALARAGAILAQPGRSVDHARVIGQLSQDGHLSVRYGIMTALSCAIAVLGLLLSSPAVIIGAMLISPLMGPTISFGFSLAILDYRLVLRSLISIMVGTALAIGQSALIVWLSPLQSVTPEILSRIHPNFFDLLVAVFAGVAGALAVAQHKGEMLVGVAIATALMPPLAVVGFGLATWNWAILSGAAGLYMTNLLAIGLTASLVARLFGFGSHASAHATFWQAVGIVAVFVVLSIPLGFSLKRIASEAVRTSIVRTTLEEYFASEQGHIYAVDITYPRLRPIQIDSLVLVQKSDRAAEATLQRMIADKLGTPVHLTLSQVPVRARESLDERAVATLVRSLEPTPPPPPKPAPDMVAIAAHATSLSPLDISVDPRSKHLVLRSGPLTSERLTMLAAGGADLGKRFPKWQFDFRLPLNALPSLSFAEQSSALDAHATASLQAIAWALATSKVTQIRVLGYSDSGGRASANRRMALARAQAVADWFTANGITAKAESAYPAPDQLRLERENGRAAFRRVEVLPATD